MATKKSEPNRGAYDRIAALYDDDMGRSAPPESVSFYVARARQSGGPVLELACGNGRIALAIAKAGCRVHGVDASQPMLDGLSRKAAHELTPEEAVRLTWTMGDLRTYSAGTRYALILCPYSAFTYLLEPEDQAAVLENARRQLLPDGTLILDLFVQHHEMLLLPDSHVFHDYRRVRGDGTVLEREKTIQKDLARQINVIRRTYKILRPDGSLIESFTTEDRIRYFSRGEIRRLLTEHGFRVDEEYGGFAGEPLDYDAKTMVFVARRTSKNHFPVVDAENYG